MWVCWRKRKKVRAVSSSMSEDSELSKLYFLPDSIHIKKYDDALKTVTISTKVHPLTIPQEIPLN